MDSRRRIAGRQAVGAGAGLEHALDHIHQIYASRGLIAWDRMGTRSRIIKREGKVIAIPGHSMPDYLVLYSPGGNFSPVPILFDAKTTMAKYSWTLETKKRHQQATLDRYAAMGALCFFAVECRRSTILYLLRVLHQSDPFHVSPAHVAFRHWSFETNQRDAPVLCVKGDAWGVYDYLPTLGQYWL